MLKDKIKKKINYTKCSKTKNEKLREWENNMK
jgi:hypothetical protein